MPNTRIRIYRNAQPGRDGTLAEDILVIGPAGKVRSIYGGQYYAGNLRGQLVEWEGHKQSTYNDVDETGSVVWLDATTAHETKWKLISGSVADPGPQSRGLVVVERRLKGLADELRDRNIRVIVAEDDVVSEETRAAILANRVVITMDDAHYRYDAPCFDIGIVSLRLLSSLEPVSTAKTISKALTQFAAWNRRHGWMLLMRNDGAHEFWPLAD